MSTDHIVLRFKLALEEQEREAVAPPEWEETVKKMKKHPEIDNPWALAWHMKNKGFTPHNASDPKVFLAALRHVTHDAIVDINFEVMDAGFEARKALATLPKRVAVLEGVIRQTFEGTQEEKQKALKAAFALGEAGKEAHLALMKLAKAYDVLNKIIDAAGKDQPASMNDLLRSAAGPRLPEGFVHTVAAFAVKAKLRSAAIDKMYELIRSSQTAAQNADPTAKKKLDAAYDKLFDFGQDAANAGRQLVEKAGQISDSFTEGPSSDAIELLNDAVRDWDRNRGYHLQARTKPTHEIVSAAEQSWGYAMKIGTQIVMLDRALKGEF